MPPVLLASDDLAPLGVNNNQAALNTDSDPMRVDVNSNEDKDISFGTDSVPSTKGWSAPHSLSSASDRSTSTNRKGRHVDLDTTPGEIARASISMPPPATIPLRGRAQSSQPPPKPIEEDPVMKDTEMATQDGLSPSLSATRSGVESGPSTTTATSPVFVTTSSTPYLSTHGPSTSHSLSTPDHMNLSNSRSSQGSLTSQTSVPPTPCPATTSTGKPIPPTQQVVGRSRSRTKQRRISSSPGASSGGSERGPHGLRESKSPTIGTIGVCALDVKARSKPSRNILTRLASKGDFDIIVFGDKTILDEKVEDWPVCDYLISFFSDGFPLDKAIEYTKLRHPFSVNDLPMQKVLWDRRICLRILDRIKVPTPKRIEVNRDGGPKVGSAELAEHLAEKTGVRLDGPESGMGGGSPHTRKVELLDDGDTLSVDGALLKKPFVEKPTSGEDHNIRIYYPKNQGGGGRRLFRKVGNKSSELDENLIIPRAVSEENSSYIYEQFLHMDNAEDVKAYTVGTNFCHAETRKSPVVDGLVRRNTHGKEIRYITGLTKDEAGMASRIADSFGQRVCGFDLLRVGGKSYVIDVNGWSFVKDNKEYYDKCADLLRDMFIQHKRSASGVNLHDQESSLTENANDQAGAGPGRHSSTSHRTTLKSILGRSPSLPRLAGGHYRSNSRNTHGTASPDQSFSLTSPPSLEQALPPRLRAFDFDAEHSNSSAPSTSPSGSNTLQRMHSAEQTPQGYVTPAPTPAPKHSWKLKGMVSVIRHADRTPKQKFKFTFHTKPFIDLLNGHQEEVLLKGEGALKSVEDAVKIALREGIEDKDKLKLLRTSLARKGAWVGTKVQIKPMFRKPKPEDLPAIGDALMRTHSREAGATDTKPESTSNSEVTIVAAAAAVANDGVTEETKDLGGQGPVRSDSISGVTLSRISAAENNLVLDKLQLVVKWGGEPTHSARYQAQDLGSNMREDLLLMNGEAIEDVAIFSSSERRVSTSAQIWASAFLNEKEIPGNLVKIRKDLLDDSNAAKDEMDKVKKKLKTLLREGHERPPQFAWPKDNMPEPSVVLKTVVELMKFHRRVMRQNYTKLAAGATSSLAAIAHPGDVSQNMGTTSSGAPAQSQAVSAIQDRWCCGEDAELFRERWEKLFAEFCDSEKVDPSKISELYDTMKFDALHNRKFLEWVFTPESSTLEESASEDKSPTLRSSEAGHIDTDSLPSFSTSKSIDKADGTTLSDKTEKPNIAHRMGFRRRSMLNAQTLAKTAAEEERKESYFKLFTGTGQTKAKLDVRLEKLRELYKLAKVLFDFVCPQEYGIEDREKLEIGLLTSLPLLKEIVKDLEEVQASGDAKTFVYFTKESHIYTLLNCILEGGIKTKIERNAIPELDYLSQICFELYESENKVADGPAVGEATTFAYSIRISISPGCHTVDPLDLQLDAKHSIGCAPRRSLTAHGDWKDVIETLRAKFHQ